MRILHYLFGTPPVRGGGLIKYALDLAETQSKEDDVFLLIPGPISLSPQRRNKVSVKRKGKWNGIPQYKIYNPLPIPMGNGISDIEAYTVACDIFCYQNFLEKIRPDVIHVHSLMGIHKEFFVAAKKLKIPVLYTTHDYFGICPGTSLFYKGGVCNCIGINCGECSKNAFSEKRLLIEQSALYRAYRNSGWLIRLLRTNVLKNAMGSVRSTTYPKEDKSAERQKDTNTNLSNMQLSQNEYELLLTYYREIFGTITYFHFNSNISKMIFEEKLGPLPGQVIPISNKSVKDRRKHHVSRDKLKIGFLGGDVECKGLHQLQTVIGELYAAGKRQMVLQVYGSYERKMYPFCEYFDAYNEDEKESVFEKMDILAVPSLWMETFGMVVLEALSFGVPVVLTDKVGAKILIEEQSEKFGEILPDSEVAWKVYFEKLYENKELVSLYSQNICSAEIELDYEKHVAAMKNILENMLTKH